MPLEEIAGGVLRFLGKIIFELVIETFFYGTGRVLIWTFTIGRFSSAPPKSRRQSNDQTPRRASGRHEADPNLATLIGAVFWIVLTVLFFTLA